jgi:hypothetical protein
MNGTYGAYETDPDLEKGGVTFSLGSKGTFKLARAGGANQRYKETVRKLTQPYRRQIANGTIDPEQADALLAKAFARSVIVGWEGVTGRDGEPMDFTVANAEKLLTDLPDLFADLRSLAEDMNAYRKEDVEAEGKPSAPS